MGYNGNNRGRTHKWSASDFSKSSYNKGLKMFSKASSAPFVFLSKSNKRSRRNTSQYSSFVNIDDLFLSKPSLKSRFPSAVDRKHTILLCFLNGIVIMNVYQILDLLFGLTQWELWDFETLFGPALSLIGECIVIGIPICIIVAILKSIRKHVETKFNLLLICSSCLIVGSIIGLCFLGQNWDNILHEMGSPATWFGGPVIGFCIYMIVYLAPNYNP